MASYKEFATRRAAREHIKTMRGWAARAVKLQVTWDRAAWVIECGSARYPHGDSYKYLGDDGFVR